MSMKVISDFYRENLLDQYGKPIEEMLKEIHNLTSAEKMFESINFDFGGLNDSDVSKLKFTTTIVGSFFGTMILIGRQDFQFFWCMLNEIISPENTKLILSRIDACKNENQKKIVKKSVISQINSFFGAIAKNQIRQIG